MLGFVHLLLEREARPLAYAAAEAVALPTRRAVGRALWSVGLLFGALVLAIAALAIAAIAASALALDLLPDARLVLGTAALGLVVVALVLGVGGVLFGRAITPEKIAWEGKSAFRAEHRRRTRAAAANGRTPSDPLSSSYAFARGFADGLRDDEPGASRPL